MVLIVKGPLNLKFIAIIFYSGGPVARFLDIFFMIVVCQDLGSIHVG